MTIERCAHWKPRKQRGWVQTGLATGSGDLELDPAGDGELLCEVWDSEGSSVTVMYVS